MIIIYSKTIMLPSIEYNDNIYCIYYYSNNNNNY